MFQILSNTDLAWKMQSGEKRFKTISRNPLSREQETCQQCFETISIRMFCEDQGAEFESVFIKNETPLDIKEEKVEEQKPVSQKVSQKNVIVLKPSPFEGFSKIVSIKKPEKRFLPIQNVVVKRIIKPNETTLKEISLKNLKIVKIVQNTQKTVVSPEVKIPDSSVNALKSQKERVSEKNFTVEKEKDVQILSPIKEIIDLEAEEEVTTEKIIEKTSSLPSKVTRKVIEKAKTQQIFIPDGVELPDLSKFVPPFSFSVNQSDGSTSYVSQELQNGTLWITNFDLNALKCEICDEIFSSIGGLCVHRRDKHFFQPNSIECAACQEIRQSNLEKLRHTLYCRKREEIKAGYCYICSKQFDGQLKLSRHLKENHKKVLEFLPNAELLTKCYMCRKMIRTRYQNEHLKHHRNEMKAAQQKIIEKEKYQANLSDIAKFQVVPEGVELPSTTLLRETRYSMKHPQPDGTIAYLESQGDNLWITNFDLTNRQCDLCEKKFPSITSLVCHRRDFHFFPADSTECTACSERFFGAFTLSHSLYCRKRKEIRVGFCYLCKQQFQNYASLEKHLEEKVKIQKEQKEIYVDCEICEKKVCKKQLKQHMAIHERPNIFECAHCDRKYTRKTMMLQHLGHHHFPSLCKYSCEKCEKPKFFMKSNDWRRHMDSHEGKKFVCNHCDKTFTKNGLIHHRQHVKNVELKKLKGDKGQEPQATCNICGKVFKSAYCLRSHMRSHLPKSERKHKCQYCEKRFNSVSQKIEHERDHTGEKPYVCTFCEKAFAKRQTYTDHVRVHTGQGYKCEHCDRILNDHSSFRKHLKIHEAKLGIKLTYSREERRLKSIGLLEKMQGTTYL
ncbi:zinc finger protein 11-like [Culicoides brevitarsis]|uniref:zinc finger protein 11-like n=1 Tax=Culicoides brevitarsis TaxID=469753 RepID=UPI00307B562C